MATVTSAYWRECSCSRRWRNEKELLFRGKKEPSEAEARSSNTALTFADNPNEALNMEIEYDNNRGNG